MTRLDQALRWCRNHFDGEPYPWRHFVALFNAGLLLPLDDDDCRDIDRAKLTRRQLAILEKPF